MKERLQQIAQERETVREDARIEAALAPLRELEPTAELRLKDRRRLAAALAEQESLRLRPRLPLWRRTVTLPLPLIFLLVALALAVGAALAWWLDLWTPAPRPVQPVPAAMLRGPSFPSPWDHAAS
jgi:hypothetical protein